MAERLERIFQLSAHGTTPRREVLAGVTTFLTMGYIIFVQPAFLSKAGMDAGAVTTATCLTAALATVVGVLVEVPMMLSLVAIVNRTRW